MIKKTVFLARTFLNQNGNNKSQFSNFFLYKVLFYAIIETIQISQKAIINKRCLLIMSKGERL